MHVLIISAPDQNNVQVRPQTVIAMVSEFTRTHTHTHTHTWKFTHRQQLHDAHGQLEQEQEARAKLEENMKQAFMRGGCKSFFKCSCIENCTQPNTSRR